MSALNFHRDRLPLNQSRSAVRSIQTKQTFRICWSRHTDTDGWLVDRKTRDQSLHERTHPRSELNPFSHDRHRNVMEPPMAAMKVSCSTGPSQPASSSSCLVPSFPCASPDRADSTGASSSSKYGTCRSACDETGSDSRTGHLTEVVGAYRSSLWCIRPSTTPHQCRHPVGVESLCQVHQSKDQTDQTRTQSPQLPRVPGNTAFISSVIFNNPGVHPRVTTCSRLPSNSSPPLTCRSLPVCSPFAEID